MARGGHAHGSIKRDIRSELPKGSREWTPLSTGFMVASIIGFFVSILYIAPRFSLPLGVAFAVVFFCMFIASMLSMARASPDAQLAARPVK
jgi:hypothetical protein